MTRLLPLVAYASVTAWAEQRAQVSAGLGYATFIDESGQSHATAGGAARVYFTRRNAIEPELLYLYKDAADKDLILGVNYVRDLGQARGRAVPYSTVGVGFLWGFRPRFTETTGTLTGGFGVRVFTSGRFFVSPEVRIGAEPILRLQVSFGWDSPGRSRGP
jgi:hypothetical protein